MSAMTPAETQRTARESAPHRHPVRAGGAVVLRGVHRHVGGAFVSMRRGQQEAHAEAAGLRARQLRVRLCARAAVRRAVRHHRLRQSEGARRAAPVASRTRTTRAPSRSISSPTCPRWAAGNSARTVASMQMHPGRLYKTEFFAHNLTGHATAGAGRAEHRARQGRGIFPQDRVLLFHAAALRGERGSGPCPCASWSILRSRSSVDRITLSYTFYDESTRVGSLN